LDLWIRGLRRAFDHAQAFAAHRNGAAQRSSRHLPDVIDKRQAARGTAVGLK
jgi:hypothetical protein